MPASLNGSETSEFVQWFEQWELHPGTVAELEEQGFSTLTSVELLTPALIESSFGSLKLAQKLLLNRAVTAIASSGENEAPAGNRLAKSSSSAGGGISQQNGGPQQHQNGSPWIGPQQTNPFQNYSQAAGLQQKIDAGGNLGVQDLMALWGQMNAGAQTQPVQPEPAVSGKALTFDPFSQPLNTTPSVHRDICDFVSLATRDRRREQSGGLTMGDFELSLTDGRVALNNKKMELERVTQVQYMEASLKILREMVYKDKISVPEIMDYVGYLTKVATLAQTFQWSSVLLYDREYRKEQADKGFAWGADNSYLMQLLLRPTAPTQQGAGYNNNGIQRQATRGRFDPTSGRNICQKWNGRLGCTLQKCRYAHICQKCFSATHTELNHGNRSANSGGEYSQQNSGPMRHGAGPPASQFGAPQPDWSKNY